MPRKPATKTKPKKSPPAPLLQPEGMACFVEPGGRNKKNTRELNLALQGGGAHGAFTWGVLDRLLEDGRLSFEAISATSAGAMNAVAFAYGTSIGGRDGAREKLEEFWRCTSEAGNLYSPIRPTFFEKMLGINNLECSPSYLFFEALSRLLSPYQMNPFNFNPLRDVLNKVIDFDRLRHCNVATRVYLSATNVRTGKVRIFQTEEITLETVLASACLPFMFQAVEIDGAHYWDGGYMGNPAIYPLIYRAECKDVLIIHINPIERPELPTNAPDIYNRINEITFNASLMREMRAIAFVTKLIESGKLDKKEYHEMRIHSIMNDEVMAKLGVASKLNSDWNFLCSLRDEGRKSAALWLENHFDKIGKTSSIDIQQKFL